MTTETHVPFDGKYEVVRKLAEGGMGAIYKVRHRLLDEIRVIKVMKPQAAESDEQRKRFFREAQTATRLTHANIVVFHDFAVDASGTAYMVMEYVDGPSLAELIRSHAFVPLPVALQLSLQCLSALGYLHRKGIIHRDIAPDNILVSRDEDLGIRVKLIDLGIAKVARGEDGLTAGDSFVGKLRYCSPEQLTRGASSPAIDGRSDLYSFGIVAYEMLTGMYPFRGESVHSLVAAHVAGSKIPFSESDGQGRIPASLRQVLIRALETEPANRFQTAEDFATAVESVISAERLQCDVSDLRRFGEATIGREPGVEEGPSSAGTIAPTILEAAASPEPEPAATNVDKTIRYIRPSGLAASDKTERFDRATYQARPPGVERGNRRVLLVAAGGTLAAIMVGSLWLARTRPKEIRTADAHAGSAVPTPEVLPTRLASSPERLPEGVPGVAPTAVATMPVAPSRSSDRRAEKLVTTPKRRIEYAAVPTAIAKDPLRFCSTFEKTIYVQPPRQGDGIPAAPGFAKGDETIYTRPDADRIRIDVQIKPHDPFEGQPFEIEAVLVNGGDGPVVLTKIEESAVRVRGGFEMVAGAAPSSTIEIGGALRIYSYRGVLSQGNSFFKELRVTDNFGGAWRTSIRVGACPD